MAYNRFPEFPNNAPVQYDCAIAPSTDITTGLHTDAARAMAPTQTKVQQQLPMNAPGIGVRQFGQYQEYRIPNSVPQWPRPNQPNLPSSDVNASAFYDVTGSIEENVVEDRETNSSVNLADQLSHLNLGPYSRTLMAPAESTSLAAALSSAASDSGCASSEGPFPLTTFPDCAQDKSGTISDAGYVSAGSDALAAAISCGQIKPRIVLDVEKLQEIYRQRFVSHRAVSEGRANLDLFYGADEDGDTQLHICLYDLKEYETEAFNLVSGSRPDWLSIRNKRGSTPLMLSVMYGAKVEMVRALAILSFALPLADINGFTALHYAAIVGNLDVVDAILLEPTEDEYQLISVFYSEALAALSYHQVLARHRAAVAQLLASRNAAGETPLFLAAKSSNLDVTARLLTMRADPRIGELSEGKTALHMAVQLLQTRIVNILLSYPSPQVVADLVNVQTKTGVTPLRAARRMICSLKEHKDAKAEIIALLEGAGGRDLPAADEDNSSDNEESMRSGASSPVSSDDESVQPMAQAKAD